MIDRHLCVSLKVILKLIQILFLAAVVPAIFIVLASYAGCDRFLVVVWFTLAMGFMGTFYPGMKVNPLDLSPNYAGSLMAVTNGIGALTGVASPVFVGMMTPNVRISSNFFWILNAFFYKIYFILSSVIARRMASRFLGDLRYFRCDNSCLLNLGIRWSSAMELSKRKWMQIFRIWQRW